jgi:hypothetical protein
MNALLELRKQMEIDFLKTKTYEEINDMFNQLNDKLKIAESKVKNLSSKPMLADSKTILHRCSCEEGNPVEVKICLNCHGILE